MSCSNHHKHSHQKVNQNQRLVVDQNYSHNICFHCLSTLESLANTYRGDHSQLYNNKMFKNYDTYDYSSKNRRELKIQLKTHLLIFKTSMQLFFKEHQDQQWILPNNFNEQQVLRFMQYLNHIFTQNQDQEALCMTQDFISIMRGRKDNFPFETMGFGEEMSPSEAAYHQNNFFNSALKVQQQMETQGERVKNMQDRNQLVANINHGNNLGSGQHQENKSFHNGVECYLIFSSSQEKLAKLIAQKKIQDYIPSEYPYNKCLISQNPENILDNQKQEGYFLRASCDKQTGRYKKLSTLYKRERPLIGSCKTKPMEKN